VRHLPFFYLCYLLLLAVLQLPLLLELLCCALLAMAIASVTMPMLVLLLYSS
jgi:hypothetical protein